MDFLLFYSKFPKIAEKETRVLTLFEPQYGVPKGKYALIDSYCDDGDCDCRKVMVNFVDADNPNIVFATVGYGWESEKFYTEWMFGDKKEGKHLAGSYLELGGRQSKYSLAFLEFWKNFVIQDKEYVNRLKKHYIMWKKITNFENANK
jgi:hypothetical protein